MFYTFGLVWRASAAALCLCVLAPSPASSDTIAIGGTGTALGGMQIIANAYMTEHPETQVVIHPSLGSGGGIQALLQGAIDLALSARSLKENERAQGAREAEYALTPLVIATHPGRTASNITSDELASIYSGANTVWPDGTRIRLVLRPLEDTDTKILRKLSAPLAEAVDKSYSHPGMITSATDQDTAELIQSLPGAMGTLTLAQIRSEERRIRALALDGVEPTPATLASGAYALSKPLFLVTTGASSPTVQQFVSFVFSPVGQRLLSETGHLPLPRP